MALGLALTIAGCNDGSDTGYIVQVAQAEHLTALTAAVTKAGLTATLSDGSARLTVFAPTDAAFNTLAVQLGFADANALVAALPASALANILTYHVLPTEKTSTQLAAGGTFPTDYSFEGAAATVAVAGGSGVTLTDADLTTAHVTTADVAASNGIIHVVDKVLVPPGVLNVVQMAQANPEFTSLVGAIVATNLQGTLSGAGPFTVFAPTNAAFDAAASITATLTTDQLAQVLTYHVLPAQVLAADIPFGTPVATVLGQTLTINSGTPPTIVDTTPQAADIVATDVRASNGVIHVIDKVLIPAL
jgi:transforming growth factor-beta-induced protein